MDGTRTVASAGLPETGMLAWWRMCERMDRVRRGQGQWLERLGFGPQETEARLVLQTPELTLKAHAAPGAGGRPVLLVPAPIKQAYIWDLAPAASVVQACLRHGLRPYLLSWQPPPGGAGLDDYGERFLQACLAAIAGECGEQPVALIGHSLGGILAAIFAALHADAVGALVLLGAPVHFGYAAEDGALGPVIAAVERGGLLAAMPDRVPGSVLSQAGFMASPAAFGRERWRDWLRSLAVPDALRLHLQVERWSLDEMPLSGQLIKDLVRRLYRGDGLTGGRLRIGKRVAAAAAVRSPLLVVGDRDCAVVPPAAVQPFYERAASAEKCWLWYEGDVGVAIRHVGMLVGPNAHARLWPAILQWILGRGPGSA